MNTINITETYKNTDELVEALIVEMDKALPSLFLLEGYRMDRDELADLENLAKIRGTWDEDEFPVSILLDAHADDLPERLPAAKEAVRERKVAVLRGAEIMARQEGHYRIMYRLRDAWIELCKACGGVDQMIAEGAPRWEGYALTFAGYEYELLPTGSGWKLIGQGGAMGESNCLDEDEAKFWAEGVIFEITEFFAPKKQGGEIWASAEGHVLIKWTEGYALYKRKPVWDGGHPTLIPIEAKTDEEAIASAWRIIADLDAYREAAEMVRAEAAIVKIIAKRHHTEEGR